MSNQWPDSLVKPSAEHVADLLDGFWLCLADLPELIVREERLLSAFCTSDLRKIVLRMVLALNGIEHPESTKNLNIYLSARQRNALEKTLLVPEATREALIGQAVALIVIYRWYAPQLVDQFRISYPEKTEQKTLNHLSDTLADWPRSITTD